MGILAYTLIDLADLPSDITAASAPPQSYNNFRIDGPTVAINAKSLSRLKPGLYIINGRKVAIK